jgi:hypothetical protein
MIKGAALIIGLTIGRVILIPFTARLGNRWAVFV